jgi:hypothetical protein
MLVFFVASAAASSAYLTVSRFLVELRGWRSPSSTPSAPLVGAGAPALFGAIVDTGDPGQLFAGYALAAVFDDGSAVVARVFGVVMLERRPLGRLRLTPHHYGSSSEELVDHAAGGIDGLQPVRQLRPAFTVGRDHVRLPHEGLWFRSGCRRARAPTR